MKYMSNMAIILVITIGLLITIPSERTSAQCGYGGGFICGKFEKKEVPFANTVHVYYFFTPYGGTQWAVDPLLSDASGQQIDLDALDGKFVRIWMPDFNPAGCDFPDLMCLTSIAGYEIAPDCEPVVNFSVDRDVISAGDCTVLRWSVDNVSGFDGVTLDGECVDPEGSRKVCPLSDTTYTLRLSPSYGEIVREVRVHVIAPTPTLVPTPTPVPMPTPDFTEARHWLDEKMALIASLETVDIPANLFTVPGVRAYDESAARELLSRLNAQLGQGTLTPEQLEALQRLTLEERALAQMLPAYTSVGASLTDVYADSVKTALGVMFALHPAWNVCRSKVPFCDRLQEATEATIWRLIGDGGRLATRTIGASPDQRETAAQVWDFTIRLTENRLSEGGSLAELLADDSIQATSTALMIQPYLARTQGLIDRGVRTADLDLAATDRWAITGDTERATLLIEELTQKAQWEVQDALDRHRDFQAAADIARVAEDTADLATLSPFALMAKVVGLGARLEHLFIVNFPLIYMNSQNLRCVEYLSTRAAEMAFDSAQPGDDCRYHQGMLPHGGGQIIFTAYQPAPSMHPLRSQFRDAADDYRQAVQDFTQAVQAGDLDAAGRNLDRLLQAEQALKETLGTMQVIILGHEALDQNELTLIERSNAFAVTNFVLYLASAETLMAQQEGQQPQTALSQTAQAALSSVDEIEQTVALVNLTPPAGQPILTIRSANPQITPDGQLQVNVRVSNVGTSDASNVEIFLLVEATQVGSPADLGVLRAGEETNVVLSAPAPTAPFFTVQVWNQGVLMDYQIESLPATASAPTEAAPTAVSISPSSSRQPGACGSLLGIAALLSVGYLVGLRRTKNGTAK